MKILITGGAGFIGSNITRALCREHEVVVIDNLTTGYIENIKDVVESGIIKFVRGDVTKDADIKRAIDGVDVILHTAAIASVEKSIKNPLKTNDVNVRGTLKLLNFALKFDVEKFVYSSSCAVYGDSKEIPKREDMKPAPLSPYAVSKVTSEYYINAFSELYGIKGISLRYFNVFGPFQSFKSSYASVVPNFIYSILNNKTPRIYGDGNQTRDFIYVKDVVKANVLAIEDKTVKNDVINIGSGIETSILSLFNTIKEIAGRDVAPLFLSARKGDIKRSFADISKAKKVLGFVPEYSLKEGIVETFEWFKKKLKNI